MEKCCVFFEAGNGCLSSLKMSFGFKGLKRLPHSYNLEVKAGHLMAQLHDHKKMKKTDKLWYEKLNILPLFHRQFYILLPGALPYNWLVPLSHTFATEWNQGNIQNVQI
jgi:hypothetical protein